MFLKAMLSVSALCLAGFLTGGEFALVQGNQEKCTIVLPENASPAVVKAAANFNNTLKTITGTALPTGKKETSGNRIVFSLRKIDSLWTADNFTIRFPDERTLEIEGTNVSVQWAFNHILREFAGAEWILPEECGLSYTPMKDLVIPAETIEVKDISWPLSRTLSLTIPWWKQNLRSGTKYFSHTLTTYAFPLSKYGKDNSWPEAIMPVLNGKKITALPEPKAPRSYWQPCYSNPETAKIAVENILEYLEEHPDTLAVGLTTNDNGGFCECSECLEIDRKAGRERSETYFTFINRVAEGVSKKYPDLLVVAAVYTGTFQPPTFKLHPNVGVRMTLDFNSCAVPEQMEKHKRTIAEWASKASVLTVWDYSWGYPYPMPRLYAPYHLDMLKYIYEHNGRAYDAESWINDAHEGPKHYLITRFLWDSKADMKALEEEWYVRCVGKKAAPYLKAYFKIWNDYFTGPATKTLWFQSARNTYMTYSDVSCIYALREEDIQRADEAMKQVVALAETEQEKQRAVLMMHHWRHTFLRLRLLGAGVYDIQGFIRTPEQALKLLEYVSRSKAYQQEYDQIGEILCRDRNIRSYYLNKAFLREGGSPVGQKYDDAVKSHILAASKFASDPAVEKELKHLAADPEQPEMVRQFCDLMSDLDSQENLLPDGNAENGIKDGYEIAPKLRRGGSLSVSGKYKAEGDKSFMVSISGHDTCFWILAKAKPNTSYLAMFKAFIPEPSAEGYLNAALYAERSGINLQWRNLPQLKLSGGVWQTFSLMTTTPQNADSVRLRLWLKEFDVGDEIFIDDIRLMEIGTKKDER